MNNEELLKQLRQVVKEEVKTGTEPLKKQLGILHDGQAHLQTAVEALKAGQDDIRDKMATEAMVMDLGAKINTITRNHERRIEELEEHAGLSNPQKN